MNDQNQTSASDDVDDAIALFDQQDSGDDLGDFADDEPRAGKAQEDDGEDDDDVSSDAEEESDDSDADQDQKPRPKSRKSKRIDQLTREREDARREAAYFQGQANQYKADLDHAISLNREWQNWAKTVQPTAEQYQQGAQQGLTEAQVEGIISDRAQQIADAKEFQNKVSVLAQKLQTEAPEALARLSNKALTTFDREAMEALMEAANPVAVAKAISGNEKLFAAFSGFRTDAQRARFIARLDGRIEARSATPSKPKLETTPKVRGATRAPEKDPDKMSQAEYEAWSAKQGW